MLDVLIADFLNLFFNARNNKDFIYIFISQISIISISVYIIIIINSILNNVIKKKKKYNMGVKTIITLFYMILAFVNIKNSKI